MGVISGLGTLAAINAAAQGVGKVIDYDFQRKLYQEQTNYPELMSKMRAAGISPAAAAQGISSSVGNNVPSFSGSGSMGFSDVISSHASQREAEIHKERTDVENQFDRLKMFWQPKLWRSEVNESYSRMMKNASESKYFKELSGYYEQSKLALQELRPWNLSNAIQSLQNSIATYNEILSRTYKNYKEGDYAKSGTELNYSRWFNENLKGYELQWENDMRSIGFNPNSSFMENFKRLMYTQPDAFKEGLENTERSLKELDNKFKEHLGEHYKRNALLGGAFHYLMNQRNKNRNSRSAAFRNYMSGIGSLIPFSGTANVVEQSLPSYDLLTGQDALLRAKNLGLVLPY